MKIEEKLEALAQCGLRPRPDLTLDDLIETWGRDELDAPEWDTTLVTLGMTDEEEPWQPRCVNLWHFDTECIEDSNDYAAIAARMAEMAQGSLPLNDIEDHVDIERGEAWLRFTLHGKQIKIDCAVEDDWVDASVFSRFVRLLAESDKTKVFIYYDLGGQDCIIGCVTRDEFSRLKKLIPKVKPL